LDSIADIRTACRVSIEAVFSEALGLKHQPASAAAAHVVRVKILKCLQGRSPLPWWGYKKNMARWQGFRELKTERASLAIRPEIELID